jgi:hypothetical protein
MTGATQPTPHGRVLSILQLGVLGFASLAHATGAAPCDRIFQSGFEASETPQSSEPALCLRGRLNDTGISLCRAYSGNNAECAGDEPAGQDAHYGRDALALARQLVKIGAGNAGFDFTKISHAGEPLPAEAELGPGPDDWACTLDNVTGLLWEVKVDDPTDLRHHGHSYTWFDPDSPDGNPGVEGTTDSCSNTLGGQLCNTRTVVETVDAAQLCGVDGWRMPTRKELLGIADLGRHSPAIDGGYFPNTPSALFWSATQTAFTTGFIIPTWQAWGVLAEYGGTQGLPRSEVIHVRLVHGPGASLVPAAHCQNGLPSSNPDAVYFDHGDGRVTDIRSGLMWKRCVEGQSWNGSTCEGSAASSHTWAAALVLAEAADYAGHGDWRLPNRKELESLVDECRSLPAINTAVFPNTWSSVVWSGSPFADEDFSGYVWYVSFGNGKPGFGFGGGGGGLVRLVRAGQ